MVGGFSFSRVFYERCFWCIIQTGLQPHVCYGCGGVPPGYTLTAAHFVVTFSFVLRPFGTYLGKKYLTLCPKTTCSYARDRSDCNCVTQHLIYSMIMWEVKFTIKSSTSYYLEVWSGTVLWTTTSQPGMSKRSHQIPNQMCNGTYWKQDATHTTQALLYSTSSQSISYELLSSTLPYLVPHPT